MAKRKRESLGFTYDVFISFRGDDIRHAFIGHLREALSRRGVRTFFDDWDMRMGQDISISLPDAIDESKILIVAFSENYASSTWCLDELVNILDCSRRDNKQLVFPIFYHLDPSDLRKQKGRYAENMKAHEDKFGKESKKVKDWRSALFKASSLPGQHIVTGSNMDEIDLIQVIVEKIYKNIDPKPLHACQNPVGLEPRIKEVMSLLDIKSDDVRMLGIYGLGGIGKTELAKALYDKIVQRFDAACFLENVTEKLNKSKSLEDLQTTLLSEMLERLQNELGSTSRGMSEIRRTLRQKKVLLVLDDVDDKDNLEKLAGGCDWFGRGSRIIITTRDKDVLIAHKVEELYEMKELDEQHSLELFCLNAFNQSEPKAGFEQVSLRVAGFAKHLPLALKLIGSAFSDEETLDDWESVIKEYDHDGNHLNKKIHSVLKISYDRLGPKPKQVFLDIACFFKGEKKEYVENILGAASSIRLLCKKSLLTIEGGFLKMHDLIQDMGRQIVEAEAVNPGKRSRLWRHRDVMRVLTEDLGSDEIQGMMLDPPQQMKLDLSGSAFEKMKCLRILIVRNTSFLSEPGCLPNYLRVLDWQGYPSKSFPPKFNPDDIIIINLPRSHLTLQEPFKKFSCLVHMDFSRSLSITEIPDVSELQNLRELRFDHCGNLIEVHPTVGYLTRLAHLRVSACTKLKVFLRKMFLPCLAVLDLNFCASLEHFPEITEEMKNPLKIYMIDTAIKELPESIGNLTGLISIDMSYCNKLKYLPSRFFMLPNVVNLKTKGCSQLRESFRSFIQSPSAVNFRPEFRRLNCVNNGLSDKDISVIFSCFPKLEELIASNNNFVSLPAFNKECVHLTSLDVSYCSELKKIHEIECTELRILDVAGCKKLEEISELPATIQKVDARYCYKLTEETLDMLWIQAEKEIEGLEVVMPGKEIHEWFDWLDAGANPHFWCRAKFPNFALALVFELGTSVDYDMHFRVLSELVELNLIINRQRVPRKGYHYFKVADGHVLICDMRLVFSDKEQVDALFVEQQWNLVQVSCKYLPSLKLSCWGVYVYPDGTNYKLDHVQFTCPDPMYSDMSSSTLDPTEDPWTISNMKITGSELNELFDGMMLVAEFFKCLPEKDKERMYSALAILKQLCMELECEDSVLEDKNFILTPMDALNFDFPLPEPGPMHSLSQQLNENKSGKDFENLINKACYFTRELPWEEKMKGLVAAEKDSYPNSTDTDEATLKWFGDSIDNEQEAEVENLKHKEVGEASCSKVLDYDPQQHKLMMMKMFYEGVTKAIVEAEYGFPALDIIETRSLALNSYGKCLLLLPSDITHPSLVQVASINYYMGVFAGILAAKSSCPSLDFRGILMECLESMFKRIFGGGVFRGVKEPKV